MQTLDGRMFAVAVHQFSSRSRKIDWPKMIVSANAVQPLPRIVRTTSANATITPA